MSYHDAAGRLERERVVGDEGGTVRDERLNQCGLGDADPADERDDAPVHHHALACSSSTPWSVAARGASARKQPVSLRIGCARQRGEQTSTVDHH